MLFCTVTPNSISDPHALPFRINLPDGSSRTDLAGQLADGHITLGELRSWGLWPVTIVKVTVNPDTEIFTGTAKSKNGATGYVTITEKKRALTGSELIARFAARKSEKLAALTAKRQEVEGGGTVLNGIAIRTDEGSMLKINGAVNLFDKDPTLTHIDFEAQPNVWVRLDKPMIEALGITVGRHVQACFSRAKALSDEINAATTPAALDAIDLSSGWPS